MSCSLKEKPAPACLIAAAPSGSPCLGVPNHEQVPSCPPGLSRPSRPVPLGASDLCPGSICTSALSLSLPVPTSFPPCPGLPHSG